MEERKNKRSKRHRTQRNKISNKARVEAVKDFSVWSRAAWAKYKAKHPKMVPQIILS